MKKTKGLLLLTVLFASIQVSAQNAISTDALPQTETSIKGIQLGLLGAWGYYEFSAAQKIGVRTELGFNTSYGGGGFIGIPVLNLEPRFYYNLENRANKGKSTANNAGNFLAISHRYQYGGANFSTSNDIEFGKSHGLSVLARWGLRRNLGERFDFETSAGFGYGVQSNRRNPMHNYANLAFDLQIRFGYRF